MAKKFTVGQVAMTEDKNIDKAYKSIVKRIDTKLPKKYHTTDKDFKYSSHDIAKYHLMRKGALSPQNSLKTATLLAKKMTYENTYDDAKRESINAQLDTSKPWKSLTSAKPKSANDFSKAFKEFVVKGMPHARSAGKSYGVGSYKTILSDRKDYITGLRLNLSNYLGGEAVHLKDYQKFNSGERNSNLGSLHAKINANEDSQFLLNKMHNEQKHYPAPQAPKSFKQLDIKPNDIKALSTIHQQVHQLEEANTDPKVSHAPTNYINSQYSWQDEVESTSPKTRQLLGIDSGNDLNKQIKGKHIKPYFENCIYDTKTHKHLTDKNIAKRANHLDSQVQSLTNKLFASHKQFLSSKRTNKMINAFKKQINKGHKQDTNFNNDNKVNHNKKLRKQVTHSTVHANKLHHHEGLDLE